ncbi:MAG: hypothetical protein JXA33_27930 [Anaerolineae bacterium]|nr:hypothetical protein [Anaerolineae bacterium]
MILRFILGILVWVGILLLQLILMAIARFFEKTSGQRTWYKLYILPIALFSIAALSYLSRIIHPNNTWPDFMGDPWANMALFIATLVLYSLGSLLHEQMMAEKT